MITFTIAGIPPSKNRMHDHNGRLRRSDDFQAYREEVMMLCPSVEQFTGSLFIDIAIYLPDNRRDVHNCTDTLLDSLQYSGIVKNDRQFRWVLTRCAGVDRCNPRTVITIGLLDELKQELNYDHN